MRDDLPLIAPKRHSFGRARGDIQATTGLSTERLLAIGAAVSVLVLGVVVTHLWLASFGFGSDMVAMRHAAAGAGGCSVARSLDLAPAQNGYPGYWAALDRNRNGIACESYDPAA